MRVVFFGSSRFVVPVLETLYNQFDLPLVVTTEQNKMDAVPFFCESKKIEYIIVRKSTDLISNYRVQETMANVGIVADFGVLIPSQMLNVFPYGVLNIHPSLLPKYRGPTPAQNAILNGDVESGVTIIKLDKYMDHGPVVAQVKEDIKENDTAKSLYERLFKIGGELLIKTLSRYENAQNLFIPQNHENATFTKPLTRDDGFIDLKNIYEGKEFFEKMIRAYYP
jgi:methionyl-tRNA formyltransferase